jgi:hypothetical protein
MQPKEFVICLNSSTPINQYNPKIYKAINSRVNIEIPTLKDGLPHLPTGAFNIRGLLTRFKYHLFTNQTHLAQNLYTYVETNYTLVPNYFYISRGFLFSSMNGIVTPLVVFVRNKRTKEIGLYINDEVLSSSSNYLAFYRFIKKYRIDWILAGYPIVDKKEVDKLFVTPTIPTFKTIKEKKSWEDEIKQAIYAEAV